MVHPAFFVPDNLTAHARDRLADFLGCLVDAGEVVLRHADLPHGTDRRARHARALPQVAIGTAAPGLYLLGLGERPDQNVQPRGDEWRS